MEMWVLRVLHIAGGMFWMGAAVVVGLFLIPSMQEAGPAAGGVMEGITRRKMPVVINVLALINVLTGLRLYMIDVKGGGMAWLETGTGMLLTLGGLLGLGAMVLGTAVQRPTAMKLGALAAAMRSAGGPPNAEQTAQMQALGAKMANASRIGAFLMIASGLCMAASRYAPF